MTTGERVKEVEKRDANNTLDANKVKRHVNRAQHGVYRADVALILGFRDIFSY